MNFVDINLNYRITLYNRQKTSGAEGERLKEAANINKSLSTLGYLLFYFYLDLLSHNDLFLGLRPFCINSIEHGFLDS